MISSSFGVWQGLLRSAWRLLGVVMLCSAMNSAAAVSDFSPTIPTSPDISWSNTALDSPLWQTPTAEPHAPIIIAQAQTSRLNINASSYAPGASFAVSATATIFPILTVTTGRLRYQWLRGEIIGTSATVFTPISNATNSLYVLNGWETQYEWLQVSVTYLYYDNTSPTAFLSEPLRINRPLQGNVNTQQRVLGNDSLELSANIDGLSDANDSPGAARGAVRYAWQNSLGATVGHAATYTLSATEAERGGISLRIDYQDEVGFWGVTVIPFVREQVIRQKPVGNILSAMDSAGLEAVAGAIGTRLNKPQNVIDSAKFYLNDNALSGDENITALANVVASAISDNTIDTDFAFDSMAVESPLGYRINGWLSAVRTRTDGAGDVHNDTKYSADSFSINGGVDKALGQWLIGTGFGYQRADADVALGNDGQRDDKIGRQVVSAFPYVEWHGGNINTRLILGYGVGNTDIIRRGDEECNGNVDNRWYFGKLGGEISMYSSQHLGFNLHGNIAHSYSKMDGGFCNGRNTNSLTLYAFSAIESENNEVTGGGRLNLGYKTFQIFMIADARKPFGDYNDEVAYDGGIGFDSTHDSFRARLEYRKQFNNNTQYQRESVSGVLEWRDGNWSSSWTTGLDNQTLEMNNRWHLQNQIQRGTNAFNSGIYLEQRQHSKHTAGAEFRIRF